MTDVPLRLYNTMTRRLQEFEPIESGHVRLYTCGPTVYDFAHIGNLRSFLFEDILRRTLKFFGFEVTQVMNLTDIDDKTIREAKAAGLDLRDYTDKYIEAFFVDLDALHVERGKSPLPQHGVVTGTQPPHGCSLGNDGSQVFARIRQAFERRVRRPRQRSRLGRSARRDGRGC